MQIDSVMPTGHLYSVQQVLPPELLAQVYALDWTQLKYRRLGIGQQRRREIDSTEIPFFDQMDHDFKYHMVHTIEHSCGVKFDNPAAVNFNWWIDDAGFRLGMHTDGDLPAAMLLYFYPTDREDLGTVFFNTPSYDDVLHSFPSVPNTGYLMFNSHLHQGQRLRLWHDMLQPVPRDVPRLILYTWLGPYKKID